MERQIIWPHEAIRNIESVVAYLQQNWSQKEIDSLPDETERVIEMVMQNPNLFRKSFKQNVHEVLITKHNLLVYEYTDTQLIILQIWDTRQHPDSKKMSVDI